MSELEPYVPNHERASKAERTQRIDPEILRKATGTYPVVSRSLVKPEPISVPVIAPEPVKPPTVTAPSKLAASRENVAPTPSNVVANPASVRGNSFSKEVGSYRTNIKDRPKDYVGRRRAPDPRPELAPMVYLAIETVAGLGDSVIAASLDYGKAVEHAQKFAAIMGQEVFPDNHTSMTLTAQRLRFADNRLSPYKISAVPLDA